MRPRTKFALVTIVPFLVSFCGFYYLRSTNQIGLLLSEQYFTSSYKGCFIPELKEGATDDFKTIEKDKEYYLYLNPAKTGKIVIDGEGDNEIKITSDEAAPVTLTLCPKDVVARVSVFEADSDYFTNPKFQNRAGKFKATFEGKEPIETTIEEGKIAYIRMENFPSQ